jgi:hypothetical protein
VGSAIEGEREAGKKEGANMAKARKVKQLSFSLPNKIGLLAEVTGALAKAGVNIEAICAYERGYGFFMMVTDSPAKAKKVITKMEGMVHLEEVIAVDMPNKVGQLEKVTAAVAKAGIDIHFVYGSPGDGKKGVMVLKTSNDKKVLKLLNS